MLPVPPTFFIGILNSLTSFLGYAFKLREFTQELESHVYKVARLQEQFLYRGHHED